MHGHERAKGNMPPLYSREYYQRSVKIELRQRIYSPKTNEYKLVYLPFLLEVKEGMRWDHIEQRIHLIIKKMKER